MIHQLSKKYCMNQKLKRKKKLEQEWKKMKSEEH